MIDLTSGEIEDLGRLQRGLSSIRQWRTTVMGQFNGSDFEQWRSLNQAFDDLGAGVNSIPTLNELLKERIKLKDERDALAARVAELEGALRKLLGSKSSVGTWLDAVGPNIARFEVAAKFNGQAVHDSIGSDAMAKLLRAMAENLDRCCEVSLAAFTAAGLKIVKEGGE